VKPNVTRGASVRFVPCGVTMAKYEKDRNERGAKITTTTKALHSYTGTQIKTTRRSTARNYYFSKVFLKLTKIACSKAQNLLKTLLNPENLPDCYKNVKKV